MTTPPNNQYDASASSTSSSAFPYVFSNSYQTCDLKNPTAACTISGRLHKDQVTPAGLGPVEVEFGAISKQTSNFDQFDDPDANVPVSIAALPEGIFGEFSMLVMSQC